jgi:hypothetical protein
LRFPIRIVYIDGDQSRSRDVVVYLAVPQRNPSKPNSTYKGLIVSGARRWDLPAEYIAKLETIETLDA